MITWLFLALASGFANSAYNAFSKHVVDLRFFRNTTVAFFAVMIASPVLFVVSYFVGFPELKEGFWTAAVGTSLINLFAFPILYKAYEIGEFSSVYSMQLLTPVFLLFTGFLFLGEVPNLIGVTGVALTVLGLYVISTNRTDEERKSVANFTKGNLLGVFVALLWSVSVNFDKLLARTSDAFFGPAMSLALISAGYLLFFAFGFLFRKRKEGDLDHFHPKFSLEKPIVLLILGMIAAFSNVVHASALLAGFASYTIAVKRTGLLFGVLWGWLFFHEHNLRKKFFGAAVAVIGVAAILIS